MSAILDIRGLSVRRGGFTLGPVSLTLEAGHYLVLLGPNGSGKTTLLEAVAGIRRTDPGALFLDGRDGCRIPVHKRRVGYVSQVSDLFPHLSVEKNIRFGLAYSPGSDREKTDRFRRIVELTGVGRLLDRDPATLSGGEARRVALARSMATSPRVLLLDEPLSTLDPGSRQEILQVLDLLHRETRTAAVHVTHDREEAWEIGRPCAVLRQGRIEQRGSMEELSCRPRTRAVAAFLGEVNVFPATFRRRDGRTLADLGWARLPLAQAVEYESGFVYLRPESLALRRPGDGGGLEGRVRSVSARRLFTAVQVDVGGGAACLAHVPPDEAHLARVGEAIRLEPTVPPHPMQE